MKIGKRGLLRSSMHKEHVTPSPQLPKLWQRAPQQFWASRVLLTASAKLDAFTRIPTAPQDPGIAIEEPLPQQGTWALCNCSRDAAEREVQHQETCWGFCFCRNCARLQAGSSRENYDLQQGPASNGRRRKNIQWEAKDSVWMLERLQ